MRYNAQISDDLTGLYYLRARYYNPTTGRFTQEDVIYNDGLNLYAYCNSNPVMYCDPSGLAKQCVPKTGGEHEQSGIGKTGEGLKPDEVKSEVFTQIHADENGAYGYLPNFGTAYDKPEYDFTNIEWAKRQKNIRKLYLDGSDQLEIENNKMTANGYTKKDIATYVVAERNNQKVQLRSMMLPEEIVPLEQRNVLKYGNPIGPTLEQAYESAKEKLSGGGIIDVTDDEVWQKVISNSMKKDDVINTLLGLKH